MLIAIRKLGEEVKLPMVKTTLSYWLIFCFSTALIGCEPAERPAPAAAPCRPDKALTHDLTSKELQIDFDATDVFLEPSRDRTVTGDLRPLWIVSGRLISKYPGDLKNVQIKITAYRKDSDEMLDTATITIDELPALEVKGFQKEVHLLVKPGAFRFNWDVIAATEVIQTP